MAPFDRAEVEESQDERLLDLVGVGAGQEDDRDVGLADGDGGMLSLPFSS
jgi:hypothetical protein